MARVQDVRDLMFVVEEHTVTDLASRPPDNMWVRRDRHSLQRLAGKWLAEFTEDCKRKPFDLAAYVRRLAPAATA